MQKDLKNIQSKCRSFRYIQIQYSYKKMKQPIWLAGVMMVIFMVMGFQGSASASGCTLFSINSLEMKTPEYRTDTINRPELVKEIYALTAENGKAIGPDIKYMPEWRAFGWFTAADRVEWEVDIARASQYEVRIEWSVSDEEAGKQFLLQAGDKRLTGTVAPSGSWTTFKTQSAGRIYLRAGRQKLIFKSNKNFREGALLDLRSITLIRLNK